jgi:hypothetical protein
MAQPAKAAATVRFTVELAADLLDDVDKLRDLAKRKLALKPSRNDLISRGLRHVLRGGLDNLATEID